MSELTKRRTRECRDCGEPFLGSRSDYTVRCPACRTSRTRS